MPNTPPTYQNRYRAIAELLMRTNCEIEYLHLLLAIIRLLIINHNKGSGTAEEAFF
jgi:hypothetical protein